MSLEALRESHTSTYHGSVSLRQPPDN